MSIDDVILRLNRSMWELRMQAGLGIRIIALAVHGRWNLSYSGAEAYIYKLEGSGTGSYGDTFRWLARNPKETFPHRKNQFHTHERRIADYLAALGTPASRVNEVERRIQRIQPCFRLRCTQIHPLTVPVPYTYNISSAAADTLAKRISSRLHALRDRYGINVYSLGGYLGPLWDVTQKTASFYILRLGGHVRDLPHAHIPRRSNPPALNVFSARVADYLAAVGATRREARHALAGIKQIQPRFVYAPSSVKPFEVGA